MKQASRAVETHPFGSFVPRNARFLLLGSFTGKRSEEDILNGYDWFYGTKRNQFWPIMEAALAVDLKTKAQKQTLFEKLGMAITDIILSCERKHGSNLDVNLTNVVFNTDTILDIFKKNAIRSVFFSSRFVEKLFKKEFKAFLESHPDIELVTLPSPSPRYAAMSRAEKIARYRLLLPKLR